MLKVLLIDDGADCYALVETLLDGLALVRWLKIVPDKLNILSDIDLILLDAMLPDSDGFQFASKLQSHEVYNNIPLVMLSAQSDRYSKILAFQLGALDYIVKPFDNTEFRARMQAKLIRCAKIKNKLSAMSISRNIIQIGELVIDKDRQKVTFSGQPIELTALEYKTLLVLTKELNSVVSRNEILAQVWNDVEANIRVVDTQVSKLRKKLGANIIESVHGEGYRIAS